MCSYASPVLGCGLLLEPAVYSQSHLHNPLILSHSFLILLLYLSSTPYRRYVILSHPHPLGRNEPRYHDIKATIKEKATESVLTVRRYAGAPKQGLCTIQDRGSNQYRCRKDQQVVELLPRSRLCQGMVWYRHVCDGSDT